MSQKSGRTWIKICIKNKSVVLKKKVILSLEKTMYLSLLLALFGSDQQIIYKG